MGAAANISVSFTARMEKLSAGMAIGARDVSNFTAKVKASGPAVTRFRDQLNNLAGSASKLQVGADLLTGGGIVGAAFIASQAFERFAVSASKAFKAFDSGKSSTTDFVQDLVLSIPIIGQVGRAINALTGTGVELRREQAAFSNSIVDKAHALTRDIELLKAPGDDRPFLKLQQELDDTLEKIDKLRDSAKGGDFKRINTLEALALEKFNAQLDSLNNPVIEAERLQRDPITGILQSLNTTTRVRGLAGCIGGSV